MPEPIPRIQWAMAKDLTQKTIQELMNPPQGIRLKRLKKFSDYLGGFRPNELTLLCAGTGTGKTAFIATLASEIAIQNIPVFCAPVETGDIDFLARIFSAASEKELNMADPVKEHQIAQIFDKGIKPIFNAPLFIANYDNRVDIVELLAVMEVMVTLKNVKMILLDNLNFFLEVTSSDMERAMMDHAIHELVLFVKRFPVHILLICHPKKTDNGRVESEFDIKGSSTAVQESSNVILFNRPTRGEVEAQERAWCDREVVFKKIRKRGYYVNSPIWMEYKNGGYYECN